MIMRLIQIFKSFASHSCKAIDGYSKNKGFFLALQVPPSVVPLF